MEKQQKQQKSIALLLSCQQSNENWLNIDWKIGKVLIRDADKK